jgi:glycosyltransferase involved in cell wall biosynthesis
MSLLFPLLGAEFDIIDCQNFPYFPSYTTRLASSIKNTHMVITWHEVWGDYWYEYLGRVGFLGRTIEKMTATLKCEIIAVSRQTKKDLESLGVHNPIKVIVNGIDLENIRKIVPTSQISDVIFVGRLIKEKKVDILVKSINLLKKGCPHIKAVIVGDGPEKDVLEKLIEDLRLKDNVKMVGRLEKDEQVYAYMKSSGIFVSLSNREGFGLVALEANACGLPVITVHNPRNAMCDLITEGENGFICGPTEEDLAEKVLIAKGNAGKMREKCQKNAESYSWDRIANEIELFYLEL